MNDISHSLSHYTKLFMSTYHRISIFMRSYRFTSFIVGLNWLADTYFSSSQFPLLPSIAHWPQSWYVFFLSREYITSPRILYALFNNTHTYRPIQNREHYGREHWENERLSLSSTSLVSGQHNVWNASIYYIYSIDRFLHSFLRFSTGWLEHGRKTFIYIETQTLYADSLPLSPSRCVSLYY